eukprot:2520418-Pyramimonas_sp.AAC.1
MRGGGEVAVGTAEELNAQAERAGGISVVGEGEVEGILPQRRQRPREEHVRVKKHNVHLPSPKPTELT